MENTTSDFRKWLAYNNELASVDEIHSLFESLRKAEPSGNIQFNTVLEGDGPSYTIRCGDSHILKLKEPQRIDFLRYIGEHYLNSAMSGEVPLPEKATQQTPIDNSGSMSTFFAKSGNGSGVTWIANKLISPNTFVQASRFSLAGLLIFQLIVIPQFILDIDIPKNVIIAFAFIVLGVLSDTSVRLYRKHFTADGRVRYRFAWRLVLFFSILMYVGFNTEVTLLELLKGDPHPLFTTFLVFVVYLVVGALIGLFFCNVAYFTNGGKVMSRPDEA